MILSECSFCQRKRNSISDHWESFYGVFRQKTENSGFLSPITICRNCYEVSITERLFTKIKVSSRINYGKSNYIERFTIRPEWLSASVVGMASAILRGQVSVPTGAPILADALEESGCESETLSTILRRGHLEVRTMVAKDILWANLTQFPKVGVSIPLPPMDSV